MPPLNNDKQYSIKIKTMITTTVKKANKETKRNYPYLGFNDGTLVYFTEHNTGLLICDYEEGAKYIEGSYVTDWKEEFFEVFEGEIVLKNS